MIVTTETSFHLSFEEVSAILLKHFQSENRFPELKDSDSIVANIYVHQTDMSVRFEVTISKVELPGS